jgi:hypothetical protein
MDKAARLWRPFCGINNSMDRREGTLRRGLKCSLLMVLAATSLACAQTPNGAAPVPAQESGGQIGATISGGGISSIPDNPVEQVRKNRSWEFGPFANGGFGLGNRDNFQFFSAGFEVARC